MRESHYNCIQVLLRAELAVATRQTHTSVETQGRLKPCCLLPLSLLSTPAWPPVLKMVWWPESVLSLHLL